MAGADDRESVVLVEVPAARLRSPERALGARHGALGDVLGEGARRGAGLQDAGDGAVLEGAVGLRVTERELFVYAPDLTLLAHHELAPRSAGRDIAPPSVHRTSTRRGTDIDHLRAIFEDLGDGARDFFTGLTRLGTRQCSYQARQVLLLRERFTSDDLALALGHAKTYGAFEHRAVARILEARARPRTLAEYVTEGGSTSRPALRGASSWRARTRRSGA